MVNALDCMSMPTSLPGTAHSCLLTGVFTDKKETCLQLKFMSFSDKGLACCTAADSACLQGAAGAGDP